jgi:hypothetical protein
MKKKYINYLLFALVLSLCIFYFYNQYDGFQTSPVDFRRFSGTITGIRVVPVDPWARTAPPEFILQTLLESNLTQRDVRGMIERLNGDLMYPYFYINPTGASSSGGSENLPPYEDPYSLNIMPEIITASESGITDLKPVLEKMIRTFNFSRNPKITPIILANENIKPIFNHIYGILYNKNLKLVSLVLNNTIDYPTVDYSQYSLPVPILTPKVRVNLDTRVASITVKTGLSDILQRFRPFMSQLISQNKPVLITLINPDGTTNSLTVSSSTSGGTSGSPSGVAPLRNFIINNGSVEATSEIKVYKLNFLSQILIGNDRYKLSSGNENGFGLSQNAVRFMFENSPKIPDSVIQSYIGAVFLIIRAHFIKMFSEFGNVRMPYIPEQIVSINLSNPPQEIKLDIGTEMNINNTSPSSILDQLRKILCI